jgi:formylmethanofuran dehydrogenase subunit B
MIRSDGLFIDEVIGACLKGKERFDQITAKNRILSPLIKKNDEMTKVSWDEAINKTLEIINNSSNPLLYGFSTLSCEAQLKGLELTKAINGFIDSNSTVCNGKILNTVKNFDVGLTLTTLSEIINKADLIVLWGANAADSIPRLLNKILFSRGKFRMTGREIKTLIIIDPVKTASFRVMGVRDLSLLIEPDKDLDLIHTLKEECCTTDSIPENGVAGIDRNDLKRLLLQLGGAENGVIFIGQGILSSKKASNLLKEFLELIELINLKKEKGRISIVMMGELSNMVGFDQLTLSIYGKQGSLQFRDHKIIETNDNIISKIKNDDFDCSIIIGTDPISNLPTELSKKLVNKPLILIDNLKTATSYIADVILPTAISGIESGGLVHRLDQIPIQLEKLVNPPSDIPSDEELLSKLLDRLSNKT